LNGIEKCCSNNKCLRSESGKRNLNLDDADDPRFGERHVLLSREPFGALAGFFPFHKSIVFSKSFPMPPIYAPSLMKSECGVYTGLLEKVHVRKRTKTAISDKQVKFCHYYIPETMEQYSLVNVQVTFGQSMNCAGNQGKDANNFDYRKPTALFLF
jgi:hypothetical protein